MGLTQKLGTIPLAILTDASNNVGIGAAPSGTYKLEVTGTAKVSSNLQLGSTTASSTTTPITLNTGGTYGTTLLNGIKIKMFDDGTTVHGLGVIAGNLYLNATDAATKITLNTNNTERMSIDSAGLVTVIGTGSASTAEGIYFKRTSALDQGGFISGSGGVLNLYATNAYSSLYGTMVFGRYNGTTTVESMRITSDGYFCVATSTVVSPGGVSGVSNMANPLNDGAWALALQNSGTTAGHGRGIGIKNTIDFNSTGSEFIYCVGNITARFIVTSNGGIYNYSGNNVNLASDRRLKRDITPLSNEWEKLKQIEVVNYKYKDSTDETSLYGAIAQQVQEVYPELVIVTRKATETEPEYYGLREQPFQWLTTKVLQEAMAKIEELQSRLDKAGL